MTPFSFSQREAASQVRREGQRRRPLDRAADGLCGGHRHGHAGQPGGPAEQAAAVRSERGAVQAAHGRAGEVPPGQSAQLGSRVKPR